MGRRKKRHPREGDARREAELRRGAGEEHITDR
jgi:hypothetical protein